MSDVTTATQVTTTEEAVMVHIVLLMLTVIVAAVGARDVIAGHRVVQRRHLLGSGG